MSWPKRWTFFVSSGRTHCHSKRGRFPSRAGNYFRWWHLGAGSAHGGFQARSTRWVPLLILLIVGCRKSVRWCGLWSSEEAERILECNGRVFCLHDEPGVHRVWLPGDESSGLAMSRAFGDYCLKDFGLISEPEVTQRNITSRDQFVVLATDGVCSCSWRFINPASIGLKNNPCLGDDMCHHMIV